MTNKFLKEDTFSDLIITSILFFIGFILCIINTSYSEIAYKWDSEIYISWVRDFPNILNNHINPYHLQKVFPSSCINLIMRVLKLELTDQNILTTFKYFDLVMKTLTIFFWLRMNSLFSFSLFTKISLLVLLFFNINLFSWITNPANVDNTALFLFTLFIWAYFSRKQWLIFCLILPSVFTWPSMLLMIALAILFPRYKNDLSHDHKLKFLESKEFHFLIKILPYLIGFFCLIFTSYLYYTDAYLEWCKPAKFSDYTPIPSSLSFVSILCSSFLLFISFYFILKHFNDKLFERLINLILSKRFIINLFLVVVIYIAVGFIINYLASTSPPVVSSQRIIASTFVIPLIFPFSFILAHLLWFGPVMVLIISNFSKIIKLISEESNFFILSFLGIFLFFSVNSESRYSINVFFILLLFLGKIVNDSKDRRFWWIALSIQIIFTSSVLIFKDRLFSSEHLMNGPWISHSNYLILLLIFIFLFSSLIYYKKRFSGEKNS